MAPKSKPKPTAKPVAKAAKTKAPPKAAAKPKPSAKATTKAAKGKAKPAAKVSKNDKKKTQPAKGKPEKVVVEKTGKAKKNAAFEALFESTPHDFGIGRHILPARDLTRFVRWPGYITRTRKRNVLLKRLKVPPAINQFRYPCGRSLKTELKKFARKYKPETKLEKRKRLKAEAKAKLKDPKAAHSTKRAEIKSGIQRVTRMIEQKRAKLVLIANDVDPLELVLCLPALCHKLEVPYVIVKNKAFLGKLSRRKTASCVCFMNIKNEDKDAFEKLVQSARIKFNEKYEDQRRTWGGRIMGKKTLEKQASEKRRKNKLLAKAAAAAAK